MSVLELKEEVPRLSKAERLQAMEWLWASLSEKPDEIESPEWHGEVLAAVREAERDIEQGRLVTNEQMKARIGEWTGN